jgi:hypothetical protein
MSEQERNPNESSPWQENKEWGFWQRMVRNRPRKPKPDTPVSQTIPVQLNPSSVAGQQALFARQPRKTAEKSDLKK